MYMYILILVVTVIIMLLTPYIVSCSAPSDHLLLAEVTENSFKSDACMYTHCTCTCSIHTHIVHVHVHVVYTLYVNSYKQQLPLAACVEDEGFSIGICTATHVMYTWLAIDY